MQLQSRLRFSRLLWSFTSSPDLTPYPGGRKRGRFGSHRRCVVLSSWRLGLARRMAWRNPLLRLGASRVGRGAGAAGMRIVADGDLVGLFCRGVVEATEPAPEICTGLAARQPRFG